MHGKVDIGQGSDNGQRLRHVLAWAMIDWGNGTNVAFSYKFAMIVLRSLLLLSALLLAACDQAGTSTELPRPTTPPSKIVSFNGTLKLLTTDSYSFTVSQTGYVEATLLGLAAPAGTKVVLAIGTPGVPAPARRITPSRQRRDRRPRLSARASRAYSASPLPTSAILRTQLCTQLLWPPRDRAFAGHLHAPILHMLHRRCRTGGGRVLE
jgi:hypothetical protein